MASGNHLMFGEILVCMCTSSVLVKHNGVVLIESHTAQFVELLIVYLMCSHTSKLILCVCFNVNGEKCL